MPTRPEERPWGGTTPSKTGELRRCLRTGRAMRHPRGKRLPQGRGQFLNTVSIRQRPAEADDRKVPGHWQGETWCSANAPRQC
jgi:IS30 family transposase